MLGKWRAAFKQWRHPEDFIDGCEEDFAAVAIDDDAVDGIVLFGDLDPSDTEAIEIRRREWEELHGL